WANDMSTLQAAVRAHDIPAWPQTCDRIDILRDLFSDIPYMKGAFFYKAVEAQVGRAAMERTLARFYREHKNQAAGMQDMLDTTRAETNFAPSALAQSWLKGLGTPR